MQGEPGGNAYVRLLDRSGEFTAEGPTSATCHFRVSAGEGEFALRTFAPKAESADKTVHAQVGDIAEVTIPFVDSSRLTARAETAR